MKNKENLIKIRRVLTTIGMTTFLTAASLTSDTDNQNQFDEILILDSDEMLPNKTDLNYTFLGYETYIGNKIETSCMPKYGVTEKKENYDTTIIVSNPEQIIFNENIEDFSLKDVYVTIGSNVEETKNYVYDVNYKHKKLTK